MESRYSYIIRMNFLMFTTKIKNKKDNNLILLRAKTDDLIAKSDLFHAALGCR